MKKRALKNEYGKRELTEGRLRLRWAAALFAAFILITAIVDAIRCADGFLTISREVRLVMVSDLHETEYGEGNSELLSAVRELSPDAILVNGDMVSAKTDEAGKNIGVGLVKALTEIAPVYLSIGNHEHGYIKRNGIGIWNDLYNTGAVILDGKYADIELNGQTFRIGGTSDYCYNHYYKEKVYKQTANYLFLNDFCDTELFKLLLCHMPDNYVPTPKELVYEDWDCDLVLSGHTHGGQIFPFTILVKITNRYLAGLYELENGAKLYVSRGTGSWGPPVRFGATPEITLIELRP